MSSLLSFFGAVATFGMRLGVIRLFWIAAIIVVGILLFKMLDHVQRTLDWCGRHWRKAPTWRKQVYGFFGLVVGWKVLWPILPKTTAALAVGLCVGVVFYVQGWQYARRYNLVGTHAAAAWRHHWEIRRKTRQLTNAVGNATSKPNGRARRPVKTATGTAAVIEPPDGMSAQEFADLANEGGLHSATARQVGWDETKGMNATPLNDGTVLLHVDSKSEDGGEPLEEEHWWKP